jgi:PAS domain S-box-containing protein
VTRRGEAAFAAESSGLDFAAFIRDSADQIYLIDASSGRFIYANQRALDDTGYTLAELAAMTPMDLQVDVDVETMVARVASLRAGERDSITFHTEYRRKDGGSIRVEHQVQFARSHEPPVFVVHARRRDGSAAGQESFDRLEFATVVREAIDQIYAIDSLTGRFIYANERALQATGYKLDELQAMTMLDLEAHADLGSMLEGIAPLRTGEVDSLEFQTRYRRKDGGTLEVEHRVQLLASHEPPVYVVRARSDVDGAQPPAGREPDLYRHVVEEADEGIWVIDKEQRTTYANRAIADMLGYTRDEMLGRSVFDFMDDESTAIAQANFKQRREGVHQQLEFKYLRNDGSELWTIIAAHPMFDADGQYAGSYAIVTDISERKAQEQTLLERLHVTSPQELIQSPVLPVPLGPDYSPATSSLRADRVARRFAVLADPRRLELIELLASGQEYSVNAIGDALGMSQPNVSKHLKLLHDAGLVSRRAEGNRVIYALSDPTAAVLCRVVCQWLGNQAQAEYEALAG